MGYALLAEVEKLFKEAEKSKAKAEKEKFSETERSNNCCSK